MNYPADTYKQRILAIRGAGRWHHCVDAETAAAVASEADGDLIVLHGIHAEQCARVERLNTHLRQVLEIARCWMPDYATAEDKAELDLAEKELTP